jgi:hypothetical protein
MTQSWLSTLLMFCDDPNIRTWAPLINTHNGAHRVYQGFVMQIRIFLCFTCLPADFLSIYFATYLAVLEPGLCSGLREAETSIGDSV